MTSDDWNNPDLRLVCVEMRTASGTPRYSALETAIFAVFNAGSAVEVNAPEDPEGMHWKLEIDTAHPEADPKPVSGGKITVPEASVIVLVQEKD